VAVIRTGGLECSNNGETSCGCFGRISVSPLTTLTTNLMFAIGLSVFYLQSKRVE
jgi:hypothetical protein